MQPIERDHPDGIDELAPVREQRGFDLGTAARASLALLGVAVLLFLLSYVANVLLLVFAGILLAVLLRAASSALCRLTRLPVGACVVLVALVLVSGVVVGGWLVAPFVIEQSMQLIEGLAAAIDDLERAVRRGDLDGPLTDRIDLTGVLPDPGGLLGGAAGLITATFGTVATLAIVLFFGIYFAASPDTYVEGFARLVPPARRGRARYVLAEIGRTLRWWLIGQSVSMTVVGVVSYIGLSLLGVPFAGALAVLAGLLTFIPYLGPILSSIPIALVALTVSGTLALYTLALYTALQMFEGYLLTPLVQRRAVRLPPALNIFAQVLLSVLFGALGLILATPLAAVALVTTRLVYVEGVLGEDVKAT